MSTNPYYPVTTSSDSYRLTDEDWGLSFSSGKRAGVSRFKSLCQKVQDRPKCYIGVFFTVCIFLLISIIIVAASKERSGKHPTGNEPVRVVQTTGLNIFPAPQDNTILLSFVPHVLKNNDPIRKSMNEATAAYEITLQLSANYTMCNATYAPYDKICQLTRDHFGPHCISQMDYGYRQASPCVLVQLDLPPGVFIRPFAQDSKLLVGQNNVPALKDSSHIPLTCQAATPEDKKIFDSAVEVDHAKVEYFPDNGFPAYFYRHRDMDLPFTKPAVMVRFPSLPNRQVLHMTCTAWGQLYGTENKLIDHKLLQTNFAFYLQFGRK